MKYQIEVTDMDIRNGVKDNCFCCPIALAVYRVLNKGTELWEENYDVGVSSTLAYLFNKHTIKNIKVGLPQIAIDFISEFDHDGAPKPIAFEIEF